LTLMLIKQATLWWREVFCRFIVSRQIAENEHWEVVGALKWGLAEMVLWSVRDQYCFSGFFAVQFCELWGGGKGGGNLPTGPPSWRNFFLLS
jgi:hypothetical protein